MFLARVSSTCSSLPNKAKRLRKLDNMISVISFLYARRTIVFVILLANLRNISDWSFAAWVKND
jgi:hypothetical protein